MKNNAPKRKVFQDAVDLLTEDLAVDKAVEVNGTINLPVEKIKPFHNHPFHLYEGQRLDDMIESIKEHGVLNPVIVRRSGNSYEMLAGHNRLNAAKLAGLAEVPAIVKDKLSDTEAYVYVIETNLMQRSFTDLSLSEKAAVLAARYDKVMSQGKRNDILQELEKLEGQSATCGHNDHKLKGRDSLGEEYGLSGSSVARLLRINHLIPEFKDMLDAGQMQMMAAVQMSYVPEDGQKLALIKAKESDVAIDKAVVVRLRQADMTDAGIEEALGIKKDGKSRTGVNTGAYKPIKLSADIREKYFADTAGKDIERIIEKALVAWFAGEGRRSDV